MKNIRIFFHNIIFEQIIISLVCLYSKSSILSSTPKDNFCHAFIHSLVYAESHTGTKQGPWVSCQFPCFGFVLDWFGLVWFMCPFTTLPSSSPGIHSTRYWSLASQRTFVYLSVLLTMSFSSIQQINLSHAVLRIS